MAQERTRILRIAVYEDQRIHAWMDTASVIAPGRWMLQEASYIIYFYFLSTMNFRFLLSLSLALSALSLSCSVNAAGAMLLPPSVCDKGVLDAKVGEATPCLILS